MTTSIIQGKFNEIIVKSQINSEVTPNKKEYMYISMFMNPSLNVQSTSFNLRCYAQPQSGLNILTQNSPLEIVILNFDKLSVS